MPIPKYPTPDETREHYLARCIPAVKKEGKAQKQAVGQCYGMWRQKGKVGVRGGDRGGERRRHLIKILGE